VHVEALILAEGGSLQLRPLTDHLPVCLVPVGGTPILDHAVQALRSVDVDHITVLGGYRAAQVEQACRTYDVVRFRLNPVYTREEPVLQALCSVGPLAGVPLLVVRGDLVFDAALVKELLSAPEGNQVVVGHDGKPIGLWRLTPKTTETLFAASGRMGGGDGPEPELFPSLSLVVERMGYETFPAEGYAWARVATMEDLARALAAHRCARAARVARSQERLKLAPAEEPRTGGLPVITPLRVSPPPRRHAWPSSSPSPVVKPVHP
jgi:hypothetical protein